MKTKIIIFLYVVFALISTASFSQSKEKKQKNNDGVFIHLSSSYDNPHKMLMALSIADKMSEDKKVILFIDLEGVKIAVKGAQDVRIEPYNTMKNILERLFEKKVEIMVCPLCLKYAGYKPEDLKEGIKIAEKDRFFNFTNGRILTLNY